jgi:hypothetical protein
MPNDPQDKSLAWMQSSVGKGECPVQGES